MWEFFVGLGKFFWVLFQVIVLFNLLIVVHELGHYWAALWRGLKVEKFQIWFGKPIWRKEIKGVQWGLGTIPMGGFVALPQMAPMGAIEGRTSEEQLPPITPLDKIIVAFAGPLFSFLLAAFFALLVWGLGKPSHEASTTKVVGMVSQEHPAGGVLEPGDEILEVNGDKVRGFSGMVDSITERIVLSTGDVIELLIRRPGEPEPRLVKIQPKVEETGALERPGTRKIGITPARPSFVAKIEPGSPGDVAGMQPGDEVLSANGEKVYSFRRIQQLAENGEGAAIALVVSRDGAEVPLELLPRKPVEPEDRGYQTGIIWDGSKGATLLKPGPAPMQQLADSATAMFRTLGAVFSSESDVDVRHMSSAIGIGGIYYDALSDPVNGWRFAFAISVLINVNLALLNLLPFPVLDGGHITMAVYEAIRKRPMNIRFLEYVQTACALLLIGFMLFVTFYDVGDRVRGGGEKVVPNRWVR